MKIKKYILIAMIALLVQGVNAQIDNLDQFMMKTEHLRLITQRVAKNYIMKGILPNSKKIQSVFDQDIVDFNAEIIALTEKAINDEVEIELQKLNLSWMMLGRIMQKKYDPLAASKVLNYAEKMNDEISIISDLISSSTSDKSVKLLKISSNGRMLSQKMLLYYIADRVKVRNNKIEERFEATKEELFNVIKILAEKAKKDPDLSTDQGIVMYIETIQDGFDKLRKNVKMGGKIHPKTADMIVNQLTENFELITEILYEKFNE